jgi:heme-degrading monooxygenase HmoA
MVALHVDLQLKPGAGPELEKTFRDAFRLAISAQPGFSGVALLQSTSEADRYRLVIEFQSEELRLDWRATDLHQQVWSRMEAHCVGYAVKNFTVV